MLVQGDYQVIYEDNSHHKYSKIFDNKDEAEKYAEKIKNDFINIFIGYRGGKYYRYY